MPRLKLDDAAAKEPSPLARLLAGLFCLGLGAFILSLALADLPADLAEAEPERWVVALCGVAFSAAGVALVGRRWPVVRKLSTSALLLAMGGVAAWAALFAPSSGISGGIPFLPDTLNVGIARGLAGFGAVVCFGMAVYGWSTGFLED
jgi:hypothetical protein